MVMIPRLLDRWHQVPSGKIGTTGAGFQKKFSFSLILGTERLKHLQDLGEDSCLAGRWIRLKCELSELEKSNMQLVVCFLSLLYYFDNSLVFLKNSFLSNSQHLISDLTSPIAPLNQNSILKCVSTGFNELSLLNGVLLCQSQKLDQLM